MSPAFVHLHLHSEYSLTDSTIRIAELVERCAALGLPAVAVTDTSNLFALVKFYKAAEARRAQAHRRRRPVASAEDGQPPSRLTLLCQDRAGYLNLSRLISRAFLEGHRGDVVAIQPDGLPRPRRPVRAGRARQSGRASRSPAAAGNRRARVLRDWQQRFGDRLYLELTRTGRDGEDAFNAAALHLAAQHDLPVRRQQRRALPRRARISRRTRRASASPPAACSTTRSAHATTAPSST